MLSPEEKAVLANIESLVSQLKEQQPEEEMETDAVVDGDSAVADEEIEASDHEVDKEDDDVEKSDDMEDEVEKAVDQEGSTASDDAEERLVEDLPEMEPAEREILKTLIRSGHIKLTNKQAPIAKSNKRIDNMVGAINKLTQVVTTIAKSNQDNQKAIEGILEGIGVADTVRKSQKPNPKKPVNVDPNTQNQILTQIANMVEKSAPAQSQPAPERDRGETEVRKSVRGVLGGIWGVNK